MLKIKTIDGIEMGDEDRLDRNNRNISVGTEQLTEKLFAVREAVAILATKMESLTGTVEKGFANVDSTFREFNSRYATKEDLKVVTDDVNEIRKNISRGVWIILTAVIVGVLTLLFKVGVIHG